MRLSYFDFITIGKILFDTLNKVIDNDTIKSKSGSIAKTEISEVLTSVTDVVAHKLSGIVTEN